MRCDSSVLADRSVGENEEGVGVTREGVADADPGRVNPVTKGRVDQVDIPREVALEIVLDIECE